MTNQSAGFFALGLLVAAPAMGGVTVIDFEDQDIQGEMIGDYYADQGIKFDGLLFNEIEYGDFTFEEARVRDLRGMWGSDIDSEAVSTGLGLSSVTIGFEAVGGSVFETLAFSVARMMDQDISIIARDAVSGELSTWVLEGYETDNVTSRTVEEIFLDLDVIFGGEASGLWSEIAIHNHGGFFGIDDVSYMASTPVVPGLAPALAGMAGLAGLRRRRR